MEQTSFVRAPFGQTATFAEVGGSPAARISAFDDPTFGSVVEFGAVEPAALEGLAIFSPRDATVMPLDGDGSVTSLSVRCVNQFPEGISTVAGRVRSVDPKGSSDASIEVKRTGDECELVDRSSQSRPRNVHMEQGF